MNKTQAFIDYLNDEVKNKSVYLWGGQGESLYDLKIGKLIQSETSHENAARVLELIAKKLRAGSNLKKARVFDCSGLIVQHLIESGRLKYDTTANGLYKLCDRIDLKDIGPGDLVFKVGANGVASHVGACVDEDRTVIEAFGRDKGVIKAKVGKGSAWNAAGRLRI